MFRIVALLAFLLVTATTPALAQYSPNTETHAKITSYGMALRDLPENTTDPTNPEWPNEPTA